MRAFRSPKTEAVEAVEARIANKVVRHIDLNLAKDQLLVQLQKQVWSLSNQLRQARRSPLGYGALKEAA